MPYREIREEPKFREQLDAIAVDHKRIDEVLRGVYYALSVQPDNFPVISGTPFSFIKTDPYPDAPAIRIVFTYTRDRVDLVAISFAGD